MAVHKGSEGTIKVGSNAIAEIVSYSLTENIDLIETTNISDAARAYTTGKTSWGGEIATNWDETDTNGQGALTIGANVTLNLYPEGATSSDTYYTGNAFVTALDKSADAAALVATQYQRNRADEYPAVGDQLDALFHAGVFPEDMEAELQAVKDAHSKP